MASAARVTLGIISLGEMGAGIAKLLRAHGYPVMACVESRSDATRRRAIAADVSLASSDEALVASTDVLLSIVPPKDAISTAKQVRDLLNAGARHGKSNPLCFIDLNAISPTSSKAIADILAPLSTVKFVDGGIIGGPPKKSSEEGSKDEWVRPSLVVSGPSKLRDLVRDGAALEAVLNMKHVSPTIGSATGLKMCFASLSKGFTAIAIQSFTTAHQLGVLDELKGHLQEFMPSSGATAERGLVGMPPKAYRWIAEMEEIASTMRDEGNFDSRLFDEVAKVYDVVANKTELGAEKSGDRRRGMTSNDVAALTAEGLRRQKQ